jgi:hypothetical protein
MEDKKRLDKFLKNKGTKAEVISIKTKNMP